MLLNRLIAHAHTATIARAHTATIARAHNGAHRHLPRRLHASAYLRTQLRQALKEAHDKRHAVKEAHVKEAHVKEAARPLASAICRAVLYALSTCTSHTSVSLYAMNILYI